MVGLLLVLLRELDGLSVVVKPTVLVELKRLEELRELVSTPELEVGISTVVELRSEVEMLLDERTEDTDERVDRLVLVEELDAIEL
jgi:hypothetical protein